jgi:hypothetical protein
MKKAILSMYNGLISLSMFVIIAGATVAGLSKGIMGALIGFVASFLFVSIFFGTILLFMDMRESLQDIKKALEAK